MEKKKPCHCSSDFDAKIAFRQLADKQQQLAELLARHMSAEYAGSGARVASTLDIADVLIKIVGGKKVRPGEYPHCCLLGHQTAQGRYEWFCSGVLIRPSVVITAAHCYQAGLRYVVALNAIDRDDLQNAEIISAKRIVPHPDYNTYNDVCAIVLASPAVTLPAALASTSEINAASSTTLVGFGNEDVHSTRGFGIKREVTVSFSSMRRLSTNDMLHDERQYGYDADLEFVAGGNGYDSCQGDSGGPAYIRIGNDWKVAGLTSRSTLGATTPCGDGGIYSRVDAFSTFFNQF